MANQRNAGDRADDHSGANGDADFHGRELVARDASGRPLLRNTVRKAGQAGGAVEVPGTGAGRVHVGPGAEGAAGPETAQNREFLEVPATDGRRAVGGLGRLAGQTAMYGLSTVLGRMLNYLLFPLHARVFVPAHYGVITALYAYVTFAQVLWTYGIETAFFRYASGKGLKPGVQAAEPSTVLATGLSALVPTTFFLSGLLLFFLGGVANWLGHGVEGIHVRLLALILGLDTLSALPFAELRRRGKALKYALLKLLNIGVNVVVNLSLFLKLSTTGTLAGQGGVEGLLWANAAASAVTLLALLPVLLGALRAGGATAGPDGILLRKMLRYSLPLLFAGLAGMANETLDRVLLGRMLPPGTAEHQLGIYGANYKLAMLMAMFTQTFRMAAEPYFFSMASKKDAKATYALAARAFTVVGCGVVLAVWLLVALMRQVEPQPYWEGLQAVPPLLLANLFLGLYFNFSVWYKLGDRTEAGTVLTLLGFGVTVGLNVLLIPQIGYMGSAYATLACYAAMAGACYLWGQRVYHVPYSKVIVLYVGVTVLLLFTLGRFTLRLANEGHTVQSLLWGLVGLVGFGAVVVFLERRTLRSLLGR